MDGRANAILAIDQRNFTSIWISRAQRKTFLALIPASVLFDQPSRFHPPLPPPSSPLKKLQTYESRGTLFRFYSAIIPGLFSNAAASIFL